MIDQIKFKKGQKFTLNIDYRDFKKDDIIEYVGKRRSTTGMLCIFKNQNSVILKTFEMWHSQFLNNCTIIK